MPEKKDLIVFQNKKECGSSHEVSDNINAKPIFVQRAFEQHARQNIGLAFVYVTKFIFLRHAFSAA